MLFAAVIYKALDSTPGHEHRPSPNAIPTSFTAFLIEDQGSAIPVRPRPVISQAKPRTLQLGLGLRLLQDGVELGGLHDIALDLELARHE